MADIWELIESYASAMRKKGVFQAKRVEQNLEWFRSTLEDRLIAGFYSDPRIRKAFDANKQAVASSAISPFEAAEAVWEAYNTLRQP